ncbi:MAG TPA: molybdate ABC transporter substrate-binding protein [Acidimicrobiales bacterium]|nr:molybdate ABC transporter substrate-binding protein [Acidimicrobiales bacterium]
MTAGVALALVALTGCGSATTPTPPSAPAVRATGSVTVFAAASLTEAFQDVQAGLRTSDPALFLTYDFAGSGALVAEIQQGAPADVVATADTASMQKLVDAGLVDTPVTFARNALEILVAPGNPKHVATLADLARPDLKLVLGDETVPAGKYAAQALEAAGVAVRPVSKEVDVKAAVAKVTSGEADVAVVYVSDVQAAGAKGQGVPIPDSQNVVAEYPIAVVRASKDPAAAAAFLDVVVHGAGQDALRRRGFAAPT